MTETPAISACCYTSSTVDSDAVSWCGQQGEVLTREASKRAGKDVFLDPARIRDLKMVVVTVAQF